MLSPECGGICVGALAVFGDFQGAFLQPHLKAAGAFARLSKGSAEEVAAGVPQPLPRTAGEAAWLWRHQVMNSGLKVVNTHYTASFSYQISTDL